MAAPARRVDDALACGREHSILGGAAYRSRARKPLWPCVGAALAPVSGDLFLCVDFSCHVKIRKKVGGYSLTTSMANKVHIVS